MRRSKLKRMIRAKFETQGAFAQAVGCSRQTVTNMVTGKCTPRADMMQTMREALGADKDEFYEAMFEEAGHGQEQQAAL